MLLRILNALLYVCIQCQQLPEPSEEVMHEPSESEPKRNEADEPK